MPARRRRFSQCGHLGFGAGCHRCAHAQAIDNKFKGKTTEEARKMLHEASRLRSVNGRVEPETGSSPDETT